VDNLPDPHYVWYIKIWKYVSKGMNIIDLVAILPFFVSFGTSSGGSVSIVRILRLARILRVFKVGSLKRYLTLLKKTVTKSLPALGLLLFFAFLGVILFASIIFFLEQGSFVVNDDYPQGAYLRWNVLHSAKEESPFKSILHSCYWAVVTSTTVGYGDFFPTSALGRAVAIILMYAGILIIALPVGVVGSSFSKEYEKMLLLEKMSQNENEKEKSHPTTRAEMISKMENMISTMNDMVAELKRSEEDSNNRKKSHAKTAASAADTTSPFFGQNPSRESNEGL
jgi:voltage-gated potassium channel Kch